MLDIKYWGHKVFVLPSEGKNYTQDQGWKSLPISNKNYTIQGREYQLVSKKEKYIPLLSLERIVKIALAVLCCGIGWGWAWRSKTLEMFFSGRQVVKIVELSPDKKSEELPSSPEPVPFDTKAWAPTRQLFTPVPAPGILDFEPLSEQQVRELLDTEPTLRGWKVAQGHMKAYDSILNIQREGIPRLLSIPGGEGGRRANAELKGSMQFILYKIHHEQNAAKKKELLRELAVALEDCIPVTQGRISMLHMKLASIGGFDKQMAFFISAYKEKIVNAVMYELYPAMKEGSYAGNYFHQPWMQFPHMKHGFVALLGEELGLNTTGAQEDPNRNEGEAHRRQAKFKELFHSKIALEEIIQEFIIDVNGRNGQIDVLGLAAWCTPENLGEEAYNVFYAADFVYPTYSPAYTNDSEYGNAPYLTEEMAYKIFAKLGYLTARNEE